MSRALYNEILLASGQGALGQLPDGTEAVYASYRKDVTDPSWTDVVHNNMMLAFSQTDPAKLRTAVILTAGTLFAWLSDIDSRTLEAS